MGLCFPEDVHNLSMNATLFFASSYQNGFAAAGVAVVKKAGAVLFTVAFLRIGK